MTIGDLSSEYSDTSEYTSHYYGVLEYESATWMISCFLEAKVKNHKNAANKSVDLAKTPLDRLL